MRQNFSYHYFRELVPVLRVQTDEPNEEIFDIQVDTFVKGELNIYLIFSNGTMRKYTA
jgi:hypothetical protein